MTARRHGQNSVWYRPLPRFRRIKRIFLLRKTPFSFFFPTYPVRPSVVNAHTYTRKHSHKSRNRHGRNDIVLLTYRVAAKILLRYVPHHDPVSRRLAELSPRSASQGRRGKGRGLTGARGRRGRHRRGRERLHKRNLSCTSTARTPSDRGGRDSEQQGPEPSS